MAVGGPQKFKSEFVSGAKDIYAKGTNRVNLGKLQTHIDALFGRHIDVNTDLELTSASTKQDVVTRLRGLLREEKEVGCCGLTEHDKYSPVQVIQRAHNAYERSVDKEAGPFKLTQDSAFMAQIGLPIADDRLTALDGDAPSILKGLMQILHTEEAQGNIKVRAFMTGGVSIEGGPPEPNKYPLPIGPSQAEGSLRSQLLGKVTELKYGPATNAAELITETLAELRDPTRPDIGLTTQMADCISTFPDRLPEHFNTPENRLTIIKMAGGVLTDPIQFLRCGEKVSNPDLEIDPENVPRFIDAVNQLILACNTAHTRITADFPGVTSIKMTGSDMHAGHSVHIVTVAMPDGGEEKWAYKPRNIEVDKAVCGPMGMFAEINTRSGGAVQLPVMAFQDPVAEADHGTYGYAQFVNNTPNTIIMNEQDANAYYHQLGQLVVACMALGVADIHPDNIMAGITVGTDKKPYIIDAEVSFLPHKISSQTSQHIEFIKERKFNEKLTNNAVVSGEDLSLIRKADYPDISEESPHLLAYSHSFEAGALAVKTVLESEAIRGSIADRLTALKLGDALSHIRLVPLPTSTFQEKRPFMTPTHQATALDQLCPELAAKFTDLNIHVPEASWAIIREGLVTDLSAGNIPIMHFDAKTNEVKYQNKAIGSYTEGHNNIVGLVEEKTARIAALAQEDLLQIL